MILKHKIVYNIPVNLDDMIGFYAAVVLSAVIGVILSKVEKNEWLVIVLLASIIIHLGMAMFIEWRHWCWWRRR